MLVFAVVAGDALLPLLLGETMVVTGGVLSASGDLNMFLVFAAGAAVWSAYDAGLGRIGGAAFEAEPWKGLILAFGLATATAVVAEGIRWLVDRRNKSRA